MEIIKPTEKDLQSLKMQPQTFDPTKITDQYFDCKLKLNGIENQLAIDPLNPDLLKIRDMLTKSLEEMTIRNLPCIKVRYHREYCPELIEIEPNKKGDFMDLRSAKEYYLKEGEFALIDLGISIELPEGFWGQIVPRSSTFKNYGIIQTNSFGVVDNSYCGDGDIWKLPVYATRECHISINDRICQFRIVPQVGFTMTTVESLSNNEDRGGFGSTGVK